MILKNYSKIANVLNVGNDLIGEMLSRCCLTQNQLVVVGTINDQCERSKKLLDILLKSSRATLQVFIECLKNTQRHVVP
jgi:hypothetical protein